MMRCVISCGENGQWLRRLCIL